MNKAEFKTYESKVADFFKENDLQSISRLDSAEYFFSHSGCDICGTRGTNLVEANGYSPTYGIIDDLNICSDCEYYAEYGVLDDLTMIEIGESKDEE